MLINGETGDWLHASDRGLLYGDGLFETIAVAQGRPMLWERHLQRLGQGCERLGIPLPSPDLLLRESLDSLDPDAPRQVLKIIVTRGVGRRGYAPPREISPTRIVAASPWPEPTEGAYELGIKVRFCELRLGRNPALAGIKHLNRLEQVMARREWDDDGIREGLMLDEAGQVIEGTAGNLFLVTGEGLTTPDLRECGVAGVMRELVMDIADELGIPVRVAPVERDLLRQARGLFLTNSLIGIWPVRELDGRPYDVKAIDDSLIRETMARGLGNHTGRTG